MHRSRTRVSLAALLSLLAAGAAQAGGFQVLQQGAKASGRADAFTAQADDATATYYNPAAAGKFDGWDLYIGATAFSRGTTLDLAGDGPIDMQDGSQLIGNLYLTGRLGEHYALAIGVFEPFALRTRWQSSGPVSTSAIDTRWSTRELNVNVIGNVNEQWSIAIGFEFIQSEFERFSSAYDFSTLEPFLEPALEPLGAERDVTLSGHKAGANMAVHYRGGNGLHIGFSARSKKVIDMTGEMQWANVSEATFIPSVRLVGGCSIIPCPMNEAFTAAEAAATLNLPATLQFGIGQTGLGKWGWEVDLLSTRWDDFREIQIGVEPVNGVSLLLQGPIPTTGDLRQEENWRDTFTVSGGFDYHINERHTVRGGLAYDQSPIKEELVRPLTPDADKIGITGGYGWGGLGGRLTLNVFGQIWLYEEVSEPGPEASSGVVAGRYDTTAYNLGAGLQFDF